MLQPLMQFSCARAFASGMKGFTWTDVSRSLAGSHECHPFTPASKSCSKMWPATEVTSIRTCRPFAGVSCPGRARGIMKSNSKMGLYLDTLLFRCSRGRTHTTARSEAFIYVVWGTREHIKCKISHGGDNDFALTECGRPSVSAPAMAFATEFFSATWSTFKTMIEAPWGVALGGCAGRKSAKRLSVGGCRT